MKTGHRPLFALRVETPRLTLRRSEDDDAVALAKLATVDDHQTVGVHAMLGTQFATLPAVSTVSLIEHHYQGKRIGTERRGAALHLAFAGLGYEDAGRALDARRDELTGMAHCRLSRTVREQHRRDDITVVGLDACREMFGAR